MSQKVLIVVTNESKYQTDNITPTGLWLSELTHFLDVFKNQNILIDFVSPKGGKTPLEPKSLSRMMMDKSSRSYLKDKDFLHKLETTLSAKEVNWEEYDAIYYTGGHGVMFDFYDNKELQEITRNLYERGKVVSSVCHGYCGLINVKLSNSDYLVKGKTITGYSFIEEKLAGVAKKIPYDAENKMKERGAKYKKGIIPFLPYVKIDGNLITGQNPGSAKLTSKNVLRVLKAL